LATHKAQRLATLLLACPISSAFGHPLQEILKQLVCLISSVVFCSQQSTMSNHKKIWMVATLICNNSMFSQLKACFMYNSNIVYIQSLILFCFNPSRLQTLKMQNWSRLVQTGLLPDGSTQGSLVLCRPSKQQCD